MSTPFDEPSVDMLVSLGVGRLKVSSGDLTNGPLLLRMARTALPDHSVHRHGHARRYPHGAVGDCLRLSARSCARQASLRPGVSIVRRPGCAESACHTSALHQRLPDCARRREPQSHNHDRGDLPAAELDIPITPQELLWRSAPSPAARPLSKNTSRSTGPCQARTTPLRWNLPDLWKWSVLSGNSERSLGSPEKMPTGPEQSTRPGGAALALCIASHPGRRDIHRSTPRVPPAVHRALSYGILGFDRDALPATTPLAKAIE